MPAALEPTTSTAWGKSSAPETLTICGLESPLPGLLPERDEIGGGEIAGADLAPLLHELLDDQP